VPRGMSVEQLRKYPAARYDLHHTEHHNTPAGELKPNKDILLSIIKHIGASPDDCVYVGDSLIKDVAMAKDAGVSDVWAKYGQSQSTAGYQLLRDVTHWTDADVEREKKISQNEVRPSRELPSSFSEIFELCQFGDKQTYYELYQVQTLSADEKKSITDVWKTIVDVQMHFNDISLRIRGLFITLVLALCAAIGFLAEKDLKVTIGEITIHYATLIPIAGMVGTLLFYFMDRYWYHRLLVGSVMQGIFIENKYRFQMPEIGLTAAIGERSPIKLRRRFTKWLADLVVTDEAYRKNGKVHSTGKIELFYKPVVYLFLIVFLGMTIERGVLFRNSSLVDIFINTLSSNTIDKPKTAITTQPPSPKAEERVRPPSSTTNEKVKPPSLTTDDRARPSGTK